MNRTCGFDANDLFHTPYAARVPVAPTIRRAALESSGDEPDGLLSVGISIFIRMEALSNPERSST
jgi:hypothetical protein